MPTQASPSLPVTVSCPKLPRVSSGYRYYAGYSRSFVQDILTRWPRHTLVLDPWNGSGTTTAVAIESGLDCVGVDLNPVMVVVAKAALLRQEEVLVIRRQACGLRELKSATVPLDRDDPLLEWLDRPSVARFRALQAALIGSTRLTASAIADLGAVEAFWLTLLFHTVRRATKVWQSSNPTWTKSRRNSEPAKLFWRPMVNETNHAAKSVAAVSAVKPAAARIILGTSTDLAGYGIEPDLVLGSPPYCTRIDYAVATRVELSVLGFGVAEQLAIRRALIGTTTVPPVLTAPAREVGVTASRFGADHDARYCATLGDGTNSHAYTFTQRRSNRSNKPPGASSLYRNNIKPQDAGALENVLSDWSRKPLEMLHPNLSPTAVCGRLL